MFVRLVDGIFWDISLIIFLLGIAWRIFSVFRYGRRRDLSPARDSASGGAMRAMLGRFLPRHEIASKINLHVIAGYLFHVGLFVLLLFALPHVKFASEHVLGFGWPAMPHWAFIISAQATFIGLLILWLHRVMHPVTRLISRTGDHVATGLVFLVVLSGCMALLQSSTGLRVTHRFTVELLMLYFPFGSLMHAILFTTSRAYTGAWFGRRGVKA